MRIPFDFHSHTFHSHAKDPVAAMVASAFAKGLEVFGFSEHSPRPAGYDYPGDYRAKLEAGFPAYVAEVAAEKERYKGRMEILFGLEMDYTPADEAFVRQSVAAHPYEYVIGSVHFQDSGGSTTRPPIGSRFPTGPARTFSPVITVTRNRWPQWGSSRSRGTRTW